MIYHGTKPAKDIHKLRKFKHQFGSVAQIPDFNLDAGIWNPNQDADGAPTECVGYTNADMLADIFKKQFDPDFLYAAARYVSGEGPGEGGTSFHAGIEAVVGMGGLLSSDATFTAKSRGEIFASNINNYQPYQKTNALKFVQNGPLDVLGNGDAYTSIVSAAYTGQIGISLGSPWFAEWQNLPPESILPMPANPVQQSRDPSTPWHNYSGKGKKTFSTANTIPIKSWQGFWVYMPQAVANAVFAISGTGALTYNPAAIRWLSIIGILIRRFPNIPATDLPRLINAGRV